MLNTDASSPKRRIHDNPWIISFGVATFVVALLGAHSYFISLFMKENPGWWNGFLRTAVNWYLWAAFFPFIHRLSSRFHFEAGKRWTSALVHIGAGSAIAILHITLHVFFSDWLFHPGQSWSTVPSILKNQLTSIFFTRFFMYHAILCVSLALDFYRRARETEIRASRMEAGILQAEFESLKIQLDPNLLFSNLKHLSNLMYRDLDEAESVITRLGDDLRKRLVPLAFDSNRSNEASLLEPEAASQALPHSSFRVEFNPWRKWLLIFGIFTFLCIYFATQNWIANTIRGTQMNWRLQITDGLGWYIWALLTPLVLKAGQMFPLQRKGWIKLAMIHVCFLIAFWVIATVAFAGVHWMSGLWKTSYLEVLRITLTRSPLWLDIICYATILAIESAFRFQHRLEFGKLRANRLNAQLARARLQALKTQLHPHFLFNSLNSLSELMREDAEAGEEMLRNLERFLQMTVHHHQEQEILFQQELEFLKCYLAIENVRYQDRLRVKMDIDPESLNVAVPNLMLQPIVENAIRHGIAPRKTPGQIEIHATRSNGTLKVSVQDNGPGLGHFKKKAVLQGSGLGLSNTRERLSQLYGSDHRFELKDAEGGGLIVTMEIPVTPRAMEGGR